MRERERERERERAVIRAQLMICSSDMQNYFINFESNFFSAKVEQTK